ncbi:MAG: SH3 domain-containing protein [Anaerolineae bacterium]
MRKYGIGWLFALAMLIVGIPITSAQSGVRAVVVNEFANIRITPAIGAPVLDTVNAGYAFDIVTARSGDNQWIRVDYMCQEGWVNLAPLVILEGDITTLPTADPRSVPFGGFEAPRAGFTEQTGTIRARAIDGLRIRSGPSTGYPTLSNINFNQEFTLTGRNGCGSWVQVSFEGTLGWVSATFVQQLGTGNIQDLPVGGIIADAATPQIDGDEEYFATLRLMLSRLDLAQLSLDAIRASWTDSALTGRAACQDYPTRPSDFVIATPLLAANFGILEPLRLDFNAAMTDIRAAIDLFIQVCNQPGTGNPVGQSTVEGALNTINRADQTVLSLRQRLNELIPDLTVGLDECLLVFNRAAEVLPQIQFGVIYGDSLTRRTYARGYCFNGLEGQIINLQVLPIPPAELKTFLAISALDNPTDFIAINEGTPGVRQTIGPITLPVTGTYLIIVADLQEDSSTRNSFGEYAFLISDLTFGTSFRNLAYDEQTNSVVLDQFVETTFVQTDPAPVTAVCPSVSFSCAQLFTCDEASACLQQGNFSLDTNGDGIACNEPGNLVSGSIVCN